MASFPQLLVLFGFHNSLNTNLKWSETSDFNLRAVSMDSPGFVWLLSHSSWFCLASTTRLIQIRSGAEHRIPLFFEQFAIISWFCMASFPQLLFLCSFHNSLNTNPKRSGTSDFIFTFVQEQLSASYVTVPERVYNQNHDKNIRFSYFRQDFIEGVRDFESVGDPSYSAAFSHT